MNLIKLTDKDMRTHGGFQWTIGEIKRAPGAGKLCTAGWLHAYEGSPELALLLQPLHTAWANPRVFEAIGGGRIKRDALLKIGVQRLRLVRELPRPTISPEHCARFAILCALSVCPYPAYRTWAINWLNGTNRSVAAAKAAVAEAAVEAWVPREGK